MKLKEIQNLIKFVAKSGASEVKLEMEDVKITIKTSDGKQQVIMHEPVVVPQQVPTAPPIVSAPPVVSQEAEDASEDSKYITVKCEESNSYICKIYQEDEDIETGYGNTKKKSEQDASRKALIKFHVISE